MIRQARTIEVSKADPYAGFLTADDYRTRLASAIETRKAGLRDEPVYSPLHGAAKLGTTLLGAYLEKSNRDDEKAQYAQTGALLSDALMGKPLASTGAGGALQTGDGPAVAGNAAIQPIESSTPFHDLLGRAEGTDKGRGYNETLAYGKLTGGPVDLTSMPVSQVMEVQRGMLNHPANVWNSSAAGRPQIVRKTLASLVERGVVKPDEPFSPEVQNRAASYLAQARGADPAALRKEWAGLKNVSDEEIIQAYNASFGGRGVPTETASPIASGGIQVASTDPNFVPLPPARPSDVQPTTPDGRMAALTRGAAAQAPAGGAQNRMAQIDPRYLAALQYGNEAQRALAGQIIQKQMAVPKTSHVDLGDAIGVLDERGNLIQRIAKTRAPITASPGQTIIDPNTGRPIAAIPAKPDLREVEIGPEGNRQKVLVDLRTNRVVTPEGAPSAATTQPTNPYAMPGKNTEENQKNAGYASRMAEAHNTMLEKEEVGVDTGQTLRNMVPLASNMLISEEKQQLNQAENNFMTAILRRESGASIAPSEFATAEKIYFPRPGDSSATLAQKREARETALKGVMAGAGPNYKAPEIKKKATPGDGWTDVGGNTRIREKK